MVCAWGVCSIGLVKGEPLNTLGLLEKAFSPYLLGTWRLCSWAITGRKVKSTWQSGVGGI